MTSGAGDAVPEVRRIRRALLSGSSPVLLSLALLKLLLHVLTAEDYGYLLAPALSQLSQLEAVLGLRRSQ